MPVTIAQAARSKDTAGIRQRRLVDITGPGSYTPGGEALPANQVALGQIEYLTPVVCRNATTGMVMAMYDYVNQKLQYFWFDATAATAHALVEVAGTTNLSAYVGRTEVIGK